MAASIDEKRLGELRTAAEVGIRMAGLQPHTVHVNPEELAALVDEVFVARGEPALPQTGACRVCGCTEDNCSGCIEKTGHPCSWVEPDLCSACAATTIDSIARDLAAQHRMAAALVIVLDGGGAMHIGCAAVNDPITEGFQAFARSVDIACERGVPGFAGFSRDRAIEIARRNAKAKPQSYYAEPFEPHEWVVDAILEAGATLPRLPPNCVHCGEQVLEGNAEAIRLHVMTCPKSPLVQEVQKLRAELAEHYPVAIAARAMMNDEASIADLREVSDRIGKSTHAARLEYLPTRLRGGS